MDLSTAIKTRRSVKNYLPVQVEHEKVMKLIEAAQNAPSAGNLQNWGFVVIRDKDKRNQIAQACLNQLWMNTAPVHIFIGIETDKAKRFYGSIGEGSYAYQNGAAATMVMSLKALELGLATCWVSAFSERVLKKVLGVGGGGVVPIAILTVGYPNEEPEKPPRKPLETQVYFESWKNKSFDFPKFTGDFATPLKARIKQAKEGLKNVLVKK